jgi:hypothetical protein
LDLAIVRILVNISYIQKSTLSMIAHTIRSGDRQPLK